MGKKGEARTRHDRWADWAVLGVLVVALLLGWAVMTVAEGQRKAFTDEATGLTLLYPSDWLLGTGERLTFEAFDPASPRFRTTYQVRVWTIDATAPVTPSLATVLNDASLVRAQEGTAYRLLDLAEGDDLEGQHTMQARYVYVVEGNDPFVEQLPIVVRGLDVAVPRAAQAYVFSLLAEEGEYESAVPDFLKFVRTAQWK